MTGWRGTQTLPPCDYFGREAAGFLRAVGWLERGRPFATGPAAPGVYQRLTELLVEPWNPYLFFGFHSCDLCRYEGTYGMRNLFVPADGVVYVCPELVVHYMKAHDYGPPEEFFRAVPACPPMRSLSYFKALLACGAKPLMRHTRLVDRTVPDATGSGRARNTGQ